MAVTRTTSSTNDVGMDSQAATYTAARTGSGSTISGSSSATVAEGIGQTKVSLYHAYETFYAFSFTAVAATQLLVSDFLDLRFNAFEGAVYRDHEYREFDFGTNPDVPGDFRGPSAYNAFDLLGVVQDVNSGFTPYYPYVAGSKALHDRILTGTTPLRIMGNSSRHRLGNIPTSGERASAVFANYADSGYRPKLVFKTLTNQRLARIGGGSVQLSDGTHAAITWDGSTLKLVHSVNGTTDSDIHTLTVGTSVFNVDMTVTAWQNMSLCVDNMDNLWLVYKAGNAANSIVVQPYVKTAGSYAWTVRSPRQLAMPAYFSPENSDVPINNIAVAWHLTSNNGHLMVIGSHRMGSGDADSVFYASISCNNVLAGSGSYVAEQGTDPFWMELEADEAAGTRPVNDTGNCMDIWADGLKGYTITADSTMGQNNDMTTSYVSIGQYTMTTLGIPSGAHKQFARRLVALSKEIEPESKAKIVPLDASRLAFCFAGEIRVYSTSGSYLGGSDYKSLGSFNPATTVATDYFYDKSTNKVWFYYIDAATATRTLKRNGLDLNSYTFGTTGGETVLSSTLGAAASTNPGIRLPRGRTNERKLRIDISNITSGGTHSTIVMTDTFNVAPLAPTLGLKSNFNASQPATFTWTFSDTNTGDKQSAYQMQIIDVSDSSVDFDSGKVSSAIGSHVLTASTLTNGKNYQWKVRTYDLNDVVGPYSSLGAFSTLSSAITTITVPAADNPADALGSTYVISWSTTVITQAKYRVVLINTQTGATILNTGFIVSATTSYTLTGLEDGVQYRIEVTTRSSIDVESSAGIRYITPNYIEPGRPIISASPGDSFIELSMGNPSGPQVLGPDNGEFETDTVGWFAVDGSVAQSTVRAHTGTGSALLTSSGTPTQAVARNNVSAATPVDEGETYTLSLWWYSVAGYANTRIAVDWYDATSAYLSTSSTLQVAPAAAWDLASDDFLAPAGAAFAVYGPTLASNPANGTQLWFDDVMFLTADLPVASKNDLYKAETGSEEFIKIAEIPANGVYRDYAVKSGKSYDYKAVAVV